MNFIEEEKIESKWKNKNKKYIYEVQKILDLIDNIKDEKLKKEIRYQYINCDRLITKLAEEKIKKISEKRS